MSGYRSFSGVGGRGAHTPAARSARNGAAGGAARGRILHVIVNLRQHFHFWHLKFTLMTWMGTSDRINQFTLKTSLRDGSNHAIISSIDPRDCQSNYQQPNGRWRPLLWSKRGTENTHVHDDGQGNFCCAPPLPPLPEIIRLCRDFLPVLCVT